MIAPAAAAVLKTCLLWVQTCLDACRQQSKRRPDKSGPTRSGLASRLILAGRLHNGFGNTSREVAASLPYTSGAMLAAARAAIAQRTATIAPCSGFHHASYDEASGFCTFNGLMVTARVLLAEGLAHRVGIFDADMHYGDGTDDILAQTGETRVEHCTVGEHYTDPSQAITFLQRLPMMLRRFEGCDVLLYQAGADPHIDDPLGGWLSTKELALRECQRVYDAECASGWRPSTVEQESRSPLTVRLFAHRISYIKQRHTRYSVRATRASRRH